MELRSRSVMGLGISVVSIVPRLKTFEVDHDKGIPEHCENCLVNLDSFLVLFADSFMVIIQAVIIQAVIIQAVLILVVMMMVVMVMTGVLSRHFDGIARERGSVFASGDGDVVARGYGR